MAVSLKKLLLIITYFNNYFNNITVYAYVFHFLNKNCKQIAAKSYKSYHITLKICYYVLYRVQFKELVRIEVKNEHKETGR